MRLEGKVAVVTGAGTGIGRAIAERFAAEGAKVIVNYRQSKDAAGEVVAEINKRDGEAVAFQADVTREGEAGAMMQEAVERWGSLDVLVNNAGWSQVTPHADLAALKDEIWDRTLDANLRSVFYCVRQAVPHMKRAGGGAIVNNASASAFHAAGSSVIYSAAKAGVVNMTKSLARALAPEIRVNAFAPGLVETSFAGWPEETFEKGRATTPLGRLATVDEVAAVALFLAADATCMTAETIVIDGGRSTIGPTDYK